MLRFLILVAVIWLFFSLLVKLTGKRKDSDPAAVEQMVRCAHCDVFIPRKAAYEKDGKFYCSKEHYSLSKDDQS